MRKLRAFDSLTLDGYFSGPNGDFSWSAKNPNDAEWNAFVANNAKNGGVLVRRRPRDGEEDIRDHEELLAVTSGAPRFS